MPPLQPLQQTIFEQGPQSSVGMGASPIVDYREDPTVIVNPINPALALDNGVAWYALGAEAFNVAGKLYTETLDNVIEGKDASIQAIGYDLQDETDDLYQNFQIRLQQAEIAGTDLTQEDQVILNKGYEDLKVKYDEQARGVLGDEDYARFTQGNPDLSDIGSKYRRLALQTRKSYYDIENNITKIMYNMAEAQQNLIEKNENRARFAAGNGPTGSRQPSLTREEMANIPYNPMINGMYPITTNGGKSILPMGKDGTAFGRDAAGQILKDEFGKPVLVEGKDKELYINKEADLAVLGEDHLRTISRVEAEGGNQTSATGKNILPAAQRAYKDLITDRLSDSDALIAMNQLRYVDVRAIAALQNADGSPAFSADQVMRLSVMSSMSRSSATLEMLKKFQVNDFNNPKALEIAYKYLNSVKRGAKGLVMEGRNDFLGNEETIFGTGQDQTALATITNAVVRFAAQYSGVNLDTYTTDENNKDVRVAGEGTSNESIVDFLYRNPQMKIMIVRAYLAVMSNPTITRGGTEATDKLRSEEINEFMKTSFVPAEFEAADLSVIDGVVISSKSLKSVDRSVEGLNSIINSAKLTDLQKKEYMDLNKGEKSKIIAQAELRGTNGCKVLHTDTEEQVIAKQITYIGLWNPSADKQVIRAVLGGVGQTSVTRRGTTIAKNGLSDGELARAAFAANPEFYGPMGLVPNTKDAAALVRAMPIEDQVKLAGEAWQMIPPAEYWEMELDISDISQLEGDNSGIPVSFKAISAQTVDGTNVNLVDYVTSRDNLDSKGGWMPRQRDNNNTPIVRIGQRILNDKNQLVENTERNLNLNIQDIIEARAEGSFSNRETVLRGAGFPSRTDTGATDDVRAIEAIKISKIQQDRINFAKLFETSGIDNPEVTSVVDFMNQLDLPKTRAGLAAIRKLDPTFKDDAAGTSILDTITTDYRRATQPNTGELRTGAGDPDGKGNYADALFTPAMMDAVMVKAQKLGLKTVSDHLSLVFAVAAEYRGNSEFDMGYNMKEYRASTPQMFTEVRTDADGDDQEIYPETIPMGPKFGMILYDENSASFLPVLEGLIESGSSIYTKKGTSEYYAFQTAPSSPDFVLYHSAADQITPAVEAIPDTMVTTTERTLAPAPQGGWNGWGPRYDNVTKTTGTKGMPAQAATGKSTDLTKAFEQNRLHRLFISAAQSNKVIPSVSDKAYVAEKQMVAIQSDISRILSESWKKLKSEMGRLPEELAKIPPALAEIPARLGKAIDKIPSQLEGQMDQAEKAIGAIPSQLEGQMDQAKNAIGAIPSQVKKIFGNNNVASGPDLGYMVTDAISQSDTGQKIGKAVDNAGNVLSKLPSDIAKIFKSPNVANPNGFDFGWWAMDKMKEPTMAAMLAAYKETGSADFSASAKVRGLALRAAFYNFFGMDEDVVNNLSHDQTLELQKTVEASPPSKIKNITMHAISLLHDEHMAVEGHSAIPAAIAAPAKDFVTIAPAAVGEPKNRPDVEEPTVQVSTVTYPVSVQANGSLLSVAMMPYQTKGGPTVLIPTVKNGKPMDSKAAVAEYTKTGQHFGIFSTVEKATTYAKALEVEQTTSIKTREKLWFDVIKTYEGFEAKAYNKDGKWTVGAGSTTHPDGTPVKKGDVIDATKADMYVRHYTYNTVIPTLRNTIPKWDKMNANQQAALISFAYNMGPNFYGAKNRETITAALKSPLTWYKIPAILPLYNKATSQTSGKLVVLQGLVKRRKAEANLWNQTK
jgi:GH24 family phage-related lysozyme (muramidase)